MDQLRFIPMPHGVLGLRGKRGLGFLDVRTEDCGDFRHRCPLMSIEVANFDVEVPVVMKAVT